MEYVLPQTVWMETAELVVKVVILLLTISCGTLLYRSCCRVSWKMLG